MRTFRVIIIFCLVLCFFTSSALFADETVQLKDNRILKLNDDGTFAFLISEKGITVVLKNYENDKPGFRSKKPTCKCFFEVTNNSFGTMYNFDLKIKAYDDRGREIDSGSFGSIDPFSFSRSKSISVGGSSKATTTIKEECRFVKKIVATQASNKYCNIRNLPEGVNCFDFVQVVSEVDGLEFIKE
jgi:hypothetical protein